MRTLLISLCAFSTLFATPADIGPGDEPTSVLISNPFASTMLAGGTVNVLTGDYCESKIDATCHCLEPIHIHHTYTSKGLANNSPGKAALSLRTKWAVQTERILAVVGPKSKWIKLSLRELNGAITVFETRGDKDGFDKDHRHQWSAYVTDLSSISNISEGELSGRTHPKNWRLDYDRGTSTLTLHRGDGEVRIYEHNGNWEGHGRAVRHRNEDRIYERFRLKKVIRPNGRRHIYSYAWKSHPELIVSMDPTETIEYGRVRCRYPQEGPHHHMCHRFSDGQTLVYHFRRNKFTTLDSTKWHCWSLVDIKLPGDTLIEYEPWLEKDAVAPFAPIKIRAPDKRTQMISFYTKGHSQDPLPGKVRSYLAPAGEGGKPLRTHAYKYAFDERQTVVRDAKENPTTYHFPDYRITTISNERSTRTNTWGEGSDEGNLIAQEITDTQTGGLYQRISYIYDERGNVLTERLEGPHLEPYSRHSTYSDDGFNLTLTSTDGITTETCTYLEGTNLLTSRALTEGDQLLSHETIHYDAHAIAVEKTFTDGVTTHITTTLPRYDYPAFGFPDTVTESYLDESGAARQLRRTVHHYNDQNLVIQTDIYDADDQLRYSLHYTYDERRRLTSETDPLGQLATYTYDDNDNLLEIVRPTATTHNTYDRANRLTSTTTEGLTKTFAYNVLHQMVGETDICGRLTTRTFDPDGNLLTETLPLPGDPTTTYTYDGMGRALTITDPRGFTTHHTYNARGQVIETTHPDGRTETFTYFPDGRLLSSTAPNGTTTLYERNGLDQILSTTILDASGNTLSHTTNTYTGSQLSTSTDANGISTHYTYDAAGRLISESTADALTTYEYDSLGRRHITRQHLDGDYRQSTTTYDLLDRPTLVELTDSHGHLYSSTRHEYDPAGNCTLSQTEHAITRTTYDAHSRPTQIIDPCGNTTTLTYDENRTLTTDPLGRTTLLVTNARGQPTLFEKRDPDQNLLFCTETTYDLSGNPTEIVHAPTQPTRSTTRTYDCCNRLTSLLESNARLTTYTYNAFGQLATTTKASGVTLSRTYDALGRLKTHSGPDFSYTYSYDPCGNPTQIDALSGTTTRTYDAHNNLLSETLETGHTITRTYDSLSRMTTLNGTTYTYDAVHLTAVTHQDHTHTYLRYNSRHQPTQEILPNNDSLHRTYDPCGRPTALIYPHYSQTATYDPCGNLTSLNDASYTYNHLDQLLSEPNHTYTYDALHNRVPTNALNEPLDTPHTPDGYPQAQPNAPPHLNGPLTYDSLGRLTSTATHTFTYDAFNRLLTANETHILYNDLLDIGTPQNPRILGLTPNADIGAAILIYLDSHPHVPTHTLRGSVAALGPYTHSYTAYGSTKPSPCPYQFCSKRLSYFGQRFYNPSTGRWLTPDPAGPLDSPNLYTYCLSNPLSHLDPHGLTVLAGATLNTAIFDSARQGMVHVGEALERFGEHYSLTPADRCLTMGLGRLYQGRNPFDAPFIPRSYIGSAGSMSESPGLVYGATNGILNTAGEFHNRCSYLADSYLQAPCRYVWNASLGGSWDVLQSHAQMFGINCGAVSRQVTALNQARNAVGPSGWVFWSGHSQGGLVFANALHVMDRERTSNLWAATFGSPRFIPNHLAGRVTNYANRNDFVARMGYLESLTHPYWDYNIVWLDSAVSIPGMDHAFLGSSYEKAFAAEVRKFNHFVGRYE